MSKVWIFGDSYSVHVDKFKNSWFWGYQLVKKLNCTGYQNFSQLGISNEYIQYLILEQKDKILPEDFLVIVSTHANRRWFFKDKPWASNFYTSNFFEIVGKEKHHATLIYTQYLMHEGLDNALFHQFLGWVHYITDLHKWNVIVVPGFEEKGYPVSHKYSVTGSLFDVCSNEFKSEKDGEWFYNKFCNGRDRRLGHIIKDNHDVLANKIYDTFVFNKPLDLTHGFKTNIISKDNINDIEEQLILLDIK